MRGLRVHVLFALLAVFAAAQGDEDYEDELYEDDGRTDDVGTVYSFDLEHSLSGSKRLEVSEKNLSDDDFLRVLGDTPPPVCVSASVSLLSHRSKA